MSGWNNERIKNEWLKINKQKVPVHKQQIKNKLQQSDKVEQ